MGESVEQKSYINDLEKWVETNGARLFLYARQQTASYADAQDVYQEALIQILQLARVSGETVIPSVGRFFIAIKHRAIDHHRKRNSRESREIRFEMHKDSKWFVEDIENRETHEHLQTLIRKLPNEQQEVLVLKIWGELTFKSIGEMLEIPTNTAASRYRYALAGMKSTLNLQAI